MSANSNAIKLKVWGDYACFTRPEMKVERVSYDVMTPSAARNVLQAILWKPAIRWEITGIDVLNPIKWTSVRRNEVGSVIPSGSVSSTMRTGKGHLGLYIEDDRQQRAGLFLRDVCYIIHAKMVLTNKVGPEENLTKFAEMFKRRSQKGQCFMQPYLGCREFTAFFEWLDPGVSSESIDDTRDLGWMLHDLDYSGEEPLPRFFHAQMRNGQVAVPSFDSSEVKG